MPPDEPVEMSKAQLSGEMQRLAGYLEHIHDRTDELTKSNVGLREEWERANKLQAERNDQLEKGRQFNHRAALIAITIGVVALIAVAAAGVALYAGHHTEQRLDRTIRQVNCRNVYRLQLSETRDKDTQTVIDLVNDALAGKITTPAQAQAARVHFRSIITSDAAARDRIEQAVARC